MNLNQLEENTIQSFKLAKQDIVKLYESVSYLLRQVEELKKENSYLLNKINTVSKTKKPVVIRSVRKVAKKVARRTFLATKGGNKLHDSHCPFAKNIKPKNKVIFASKVKALNEGYKLCKCLN